MKRPHVIAMLDFGWFGIRCGAAYYDAMNDVMRPLFIELMVWNWRVTFEAGRIERSWR